MRGESPGLLPIFRSKHLALLLTTLFLHPTQEFTMTDLAARVGVQVSTIQRDVDRLVHAALLRHRTIGRARLVAANMDSRMARPLADLLAVTYGPLPIVGEEFDQIGGLDLVLIYGSWAARFHGEAGAPPQDVDVLVVGEP